MRTGCSGGSLSMYMTSDVWWLWWMATFVDGWWLRWLADRRISTEVDVWWFRWATAMVDDWWTRELSATGWYQGELTKTRWLEKVALNVRGFNEHFSVADLKAQGLGRAYSMQTAGWIE